jgi:hypothetical protein
VGSLPFTDPAEAVRHVLAAYELPFCPQLPRLDGDMVAEWLGGDPEGCGWSPGRDRERPAAWDAFTAAIASTPPRHGICKLQVTGPGTLAAALGGPGDAGLARELATWLAANAGGQVRRLRELGVDALLVVDEPRLEGSGIGDPAVYDPLRVTGATGWGVHVCGAVPWPFVEALEPDLVSFDLTRDGLDAVGRSVLGRLVARDTRVVWGVLDPTAPAGEAEAASAVGAAIRSLRARERAARHSLLSPGCGTGMLTAVREERLARRLAAVADVLRAPRFLREA